MYMSSGSQRPMCPNPVHCGGLHNPSHRAQYRHQCPYGKSCPQQHVEEHKAEYAHDIFAEEKRTTSGPIVTAPQVVPGPAPINRPLPHIPGMEGSGPDKPIHDPIRGNRGPDTYVMPDPSGKDPSSPAIPPPVAQAIQVAEAAPAPPAPGAKSAAPLPDQNSFVVTAGAPGVPPPQPMPMMMPQAQPGAFPMMASATPPMGAYLPMAGAGGVATPVPGSFPVMMQQPQPMMMPQPQPGQPGFAQPPPQPASPFPGYYLHQAGK